MTAEDDLKREYDAGWNAGYDTAQEVRRGHNYTVERRFGRWSVRCLTCGERERIRRGSGLLPWGCPGPPSTQAGPSSAESSGGG
jgi:hypothetical protein